MNRRWIRRPGTRTVKSIIPNPIKEGGIQQMLLLEMLLADGQTHVGPQNLLAMSEPEKGLA